MLTVHKDQENLYTQQTVRKNGNGFVKVGRQALVTPAGLLRPLHSVTQLSISQCTLQSLEPPGHL